MFVYDDSIHWESTGLGISCLGHDIALKSVFCEGLNHNLQVELAYQDDTTSLSQYFNLADMMDNLIRNNP